MRESRIQCYDPSMTSAAAPTEGDVAVQTAPLTVVPHTIGFGTITGSDRPWALLRCAYTDASGAPAMVDVALDVVTAGETVAWLDGWREAQVKARARRT